MDGKTKAFEGVQADVGFFDMTNLVKIVKRNQDCEGVVNLLTGELVVKLEQNLKVEPWAEKIKASDDEGHIYIIDSEGKTLVGHDKNISILDNLDSSGHARIVCDGKAGLVDGECNFVLPCQYEDVGHFGEGLVPAKTGGKWGFVSLDGEWIIPARFEEARTFSDGYAPVRMDGRWGFIDKSGKAATPIDYEDVKDVREGHFRAKVNGKWGIFALDGTCTLPAEYDNILSDDEYGYGDP